MPDFIQAGLGLERGTVALAEYSPSWRDAFCEEQALLANVFAAVPCEIEHIGSTAVPRLKAKPILDIAIGIDEPYPIADCIPIIEVLGYIYRGEHADAGHLLVRGPEDQTRTHHLHVVRLGDSHWERWLTFRDYLRGNVDARETYTVAKTKLAALYKEDREAYTSGKSHVVGRLLAQARAV